MRLYSPRAMLGLLWLIFAGCATGCGYNSQTSPDGGVIKGSVAHRERIALPSDAVVEVKLSDVSLQDVAAPVIAEAVVLTKGRQVPIPFELRYDSSKIVPHRTYALRATIRTAEQTMFTTDMAYRVITQGNPTNVDLLLVRVSEGVEKTTSSL